MKKITLFIAALFISTMSFAQEVETTKERPQGHYNISKFRQLKQELPKLGIEVHAFDMPDTDYPKISKWVKHLEEKIPITKETTVSLKIFKKFQVDNTKSYSN